MATAGGGWLPCGSWSHLPAFRREFLGWRDPKAPARADLVLPYGGEVVGLAPRAAAPPKSRLRSNTCGFCATPHGLADITYWQQPRFPQA